MSLISVVIIMLLLALFVSAACLPTAKIDSGETVKKKP